MSFRGRVARVLRTVANGRRSVTIGAELPEWYGSRLYSSLMLWAQGGPKYGFLAENDYGTGLLLGQGTEGQPARATLTVWPDSISLAGPKGADPERALLTTGYTSSVDGIGEAGATELGSYWVKTNELRADQGLKIKSNASGYGLTVDSAGNVLLDRFLLLGDPASTDTQRFGLRRKGFDGNAYEAQYYCVSDSDNSSGTILRLTQNGAERNRIFLRNTGLIQMGPPGAQVTLEDTGWINITLAAGFTGTAKWRRLNGIVNVVVNITGTFSGSTNVTAAGAIPAAARPPVDNISGPGRGTTAAAIASCVVMSDGSIRIYLHAGTTPTVAANAMYTV